MHRHEIGILTGPLPWIVLFSTWFLLLPGPIQSLGSPPSFSAPSSTPGGRRPLAPSLLSSLRSSADRPSDDTLEELSRYVFKFTNQIRDERGLPTLKRDLALRDAACVHNADMMNREFFKHINPDGEGPDDRVARVHRRLIGEVGENLWGRAGRRPPRADTLGEVIVRQWMDSPPHRKNIVHSRFTHLGVCSLERGQRILVTQVFAAVYAYLRDPLPYQLRPNRRIPISISATSRYSMQAEKYDLWDVETKERADGPFLFSKTLQIPDTTGTYRLRFYFPRSHYYHVLHGPEVRITPSSPPP